MNLKGKLLIATPNLIDAQFAKTVIAIVHHGADGAAGLVLNTPVDARNRPDIKAAWTNAFGKQTECKIDHLYIGGPVPCGITLIHSDVRFSENEIVPGTYVTQDKKSLYEIILRGDVPYRCFAGYSGWTGGQLESELSKGSWYIHENSYDAMFYNGEPTEFWKCQMGQWAGSLLKCALNLNDKCIPLNPSLN